FMMEATASGLRRWCGIEMPRPPLVKARTLRRWSSGGSHAEVARARVCHRGGQGSHPADGVLRHRLQSHRADNALILAQYGQQFASFMIATTAALVVGKAVLVANVLPFLRRFDTAPLIQPILFKTVVYFPSSSWCGFWKRLWSMPS